MNVQGSSRRWIAFALAAGVALDACGGRVRPGRPAAGEAGAYRAPPTLLGASHVADGSVRLSGQAPAGAMVSLRAPDGGMAQAQAGDDGAWSVFAPPGPGGPRLYAFQAELSGQVVRGEGAVAILPPPGPAAVLLRAGYASVPTGQAQPDRLQLVTFDYDGGGGAAAGGFAPPESPVRLVVDGSVVGVTKADAQGRFALLAVTRSVLPGAHVLRVDTPEGLSLERPVEVAAPALSADQIYAAMPIAGGWAVSWRLPGGGVQSSLVFEDAEATATPARAARR